MIAIPILSFMQSRPLTRLSSSGLHHPASRTTLPS
nr:MAG TPA: hypothetical protein [Caudoviricetes sp.]